MDKINEEILVEMYKKYRFVSIKEFDYITKEIISRIDYSISYDQYVKRVLDNSIKLYLSFKVDIDIDNISLSDNIDKNNKEELIKTYKILIKELIKYVPKNNIEYNELYDAGLLGLITAIDLYENNSNINFKDFASKLIYIEMIKTINSNIVLPYNILIKKCRIELFIKKYEKKYNIKPSIDIISKGLNMKIEVIERILNHIEEEKYYEEESVEEKIIRKDTIEEIRSSFDKIKLSNEDRNLIVFLFGLNGEKSLSQKELSQKLNISSSVISKRYNELMKKMLGSKAFKKLIDEKLTEQEHIKQAAYYYATSYEIRNKYRHLTTNEIMILLLYNGNINNIKYETCEIAKILGMRKDVVIKLLKGIPKVKKNITNINNEIKEVINSESFVKLYPYATEKEKMIIALYNGYINNRIYTENEIAKLIHYDYIPYIDYVIKTYIKK